MLTRGRLQRLPGNNGLPEGGGKEALSRRPGGGERGSKLDSQPSSRSPACAQRAARSGAKAFRRLVQRTPSGGSSALSSKSWPIRSHAVGNRALPRPTPRHASRLGLHESMKQGVPVGRIPSPGLACPPPPPSPHPRGEEHLSPRCAAFLFGSSLDAPCPGTRPRPLSSGRRRTEGLLRIPPRLRRPITLSYLSWLMRHKHFTRTASTSSAFLERTAGTTEAGTGTRGLGSGVTGRRVGPGGSHGPRPARDASGRLSNQNPRGPRPPSFYLREGRRGWRRFQ